MINKYKKISIIYGGSGRECAKLFDGRLTELHQKEYYPIKSCILAKAILNSATIIDTVRNIISSSSACIVILTFDDVDHTRVRQNVLIEIGMALTLIPKEQCFFITEKWPLPDDFPSDLNGVINPNYFDKNDIAQTVDKTCEEIIHYLGIKDYRNILQDNQYIYDYKRVLDDIPLSIFEEKADIQLEDILREWETNIASFAFVAERIMYLVERLKFFPDFNNNERFFAFLDKVEELIKPSELDYNVYDPGYLISICNFINSILHYTRIKLDKRVLDCISNPQKNREETTRYQYEFRSIADEIREFIDSFENNEDFCCNWLIQIMAYEYVALAYMKEISCGDCYDEGLLDKMKYIIQSYENVMRIGKRCDPFSYVLWRGYAQYDLTRAYENLYRITGEEHYLKKMKECSWNSITTRRKWFEHNSFKGVFSSALSFEYFLVYSYEYELRYKYENYTNEPSGEILNGLQLLQEELNRYCENTELGRLYDMRDHIDKQMSFVRNITKEENHA